MLGSMRRLLLILALAHGFRASAGAARPPAAPDEEALAGPGSRAVAGSVPDELQRLHRRHGDGVAAPALLPATRRRAALDAAGQGPSAAKASGRRPGRQGATAVGAAKFKFADAPEVQAQVRREEGAGRRRRRRRRARPSPRPRPRRSRPRPRPPRRPPRRRPPAPGAAAVAKDAQVARFGQRRPRS